MSRVSLGGGGRGWGVFIGSIKQGGLRARVSVYLSVRFVFIFIPPRCEREYISPDYIITRCKDGAGMIPRRRASDPRTTIDRRPSC